MMGQRIYLFSHTPLRRRRRSRRRKKKKEEEEKREVVVPHDSTISVPKLPNSIIKYFEQWWEAAAALQAYNASLSDSPP